MSEKRNIKSLDAGQLELMWNFLKFKGCQKSNIPQLKESLDSLRQMMIQKTAGQQPYAHTEDVAFKDLGTIVNCIVIEAMQLYLSGDLDLLERLKADENDITEVTE